MSVEQGQSSHWVKGENAVFGMSWKQSFYCKDIYSSCFHFSNSESKENSSPKLQFGCAQCWNAVLLSD